jgi:hypothetical protein
LRRACEVVDDDLTVSYAAAWFQDAWPTAKSWAVRYEQGPSPEVHR